MKHLDLNQIDAERLDRIVKQIASSPWHQQHITLAMNDAEFLISVLARANEKLRGNKDEIF